jgi:LPS-assembly protein
MLGCGSALAAPASCPRLDFTADMAPLDAPDTRLNIYADHANADADDAAVSQLLGSVRVSQNGREFIAEQVDYDDADKRVRTQSPSVFRDRRIAIRSQHADYDLNDSSGVFSDNEFALRQMSARGDSQEIRLLEDGTVQLNHASFTSCAKDHEAWLISARRIDIDRDEGLARARNATVIFQGVPIFYSPYLQFPTDSQRRSGFLTPIIGDNNNTGFDFRLPFYLNLGPNYDATLTPRYMSDRGEQIGGKLRYLTEHSEGYALGEYLPHDEDTGSDRYFFDLQHEGLLSQRLGLSVKYAQVGDTRYFSDLGGGVDLASTPYLERGAKLTYQAPTSYTVEALVQNYQPLASIDNQDLNPYRRVPQVSIDTLTKNSFLDTRAGFDGQFTNFARANSVEGQRLVAQPYIRWDKDRASWYASAQGDLSYTAYQLSGTAPGQPDKPRRTLPILSAEGGLRFERETDSGKLQTLEPQLFYLFVPFRAQDNLPLFDSGLPDFDFPQLFARNRYSGLDRISDADQITSALTTRLIDPELGITRLSASVGSIYRIRDPQVTLPGTDQPTTGSADYIGSIDYQLNRKWAIASALEVKPGLDRIERSAIALRYRDGELGKLVRRFDLSYRYRDGILEQTDASFATPIDSNWRLAARLRYSLRDSQSLESFTGVEYENCCWAASTTYRRYVSNSFGEYNSGVYFQLVLKGLGTLGKSFDTLLPTDDPSEIRKR